MVGRINGVIALMEKARSKPGTANTIIKDTPHHPPGGAVCKMCMLTTGLIQIALFRPYNTKQVYLLVAFDLDVPKPFILSLFLKQIMSGGGPTPIYIYIYIYIYMYMVVLNYSFIF